MIERAWEQKIEPMTVRISTAVWITGLSRSRVYELIETPIIIDGRDADRKASALKKFRRLQHSLMLDSGHDDAPALRVPFGNLFGNTEQREIVGLGRSRREDDLRWRGANQLRDTRAPFFDLPRGPLTRSIGRTRVARLFPYGQHRFSRFWGQWKRCEAIEIDRGRHCQV
jgi:hypothetical protein